MIVITDLFVNVFERHFVGKENIFNIKRRLVDRLWSKIIRIRDNYQCVRCGHQHNSTSKGLHCSHYFSRSRESTRFYWDNCDSLCLACHLLWGKEKRADYTAFKKKQLGFMRYEFNAMLAKIPNSEYKNEDLFKIPVFRKQIAQNVKVW